MLTDLCLTAIYSNYKIYFGQLCFSPETADFFYLHEVIHIGRKIIVILLHIWKRNLKAQYMDFKERNQTAKEIK